MKNNETVKQAKATPSKCVRPRPRPFDRRQSSAKEGDVQRCSTKLTRRRLLELDGAQRNSVEKAKRYELCEDNDIPR